MKAGCFPPQEPPLRPAVSAQRARRHLPHPSLQWHPSFQKQTYWDCGLFKFREPQTPNGSICYFNPAIETIGDQTYLFVRRSEQPSKSCIQSWKLRPDFTVDSPVILASKMHGFQLEDPRIFKWRSDVMVSCAAWGPDTNNLTQQTLFCLSKDLSSLNLVNRFRPVNGGRAHEKNWTWITEENRLVLVYKFHPFTLINVLNDWSLKKTLLPQSTPITWDFGEIRAGSNPVMVGNEYFAFFHSSLPWRGHKRRYFMGACALDAQWPHRALRMTKQPLLCGSEEDPLIHNSPCVIFPCGAILVDDLWTVVFGVNDENCGWIRIPFWDLESWMTLL